MTSPGTARFHFIKQRETGSSKENQISYRTRSYRKYSKKIKTTGILLGNGTKANERSIMWESSQ